MRKSYCAVNGFQAEIIEVNGGWTTIKYVASGQTAKVRNSAVIQVAEIDEVTGPVQQRPTPTRKDATPAPTPAPTQKPTPTRKDATPAPSSVLERSTKVKSSRLINPDRAKYVRGLGVTETGLDTVDINDEAARILRGLTLEAMYEAVPVILVERGYKSKSIKSTTADAIQAELRQMYGHLNHGQQRMNLGNRLRAALKGGE